MNSLPLSLISYIYICFLLYISVFHDILLVPVLTCAFIGERERAYLVVQLARFFCLLYIYIYIYHPALMYAVMFYVILNKRKLH